MTDKPKDSKAKTPESAPLREGYRGFTKGYAPQTGEGDAGLGPLPTFDLTSIIPPTPAPPPPEPPSAPQSSGEGSTGSSSEGQ